LDQSDEESSENSAVTPFDADSTPKHKTQKMMITRSQKKVLGKRQMRAKSAKKQTLPSESLEHLLSMTTRAGKKRQRCEL